MLAVRNALGTAAAAETPQQQQAEEAWVMASISLFVSSVGRGSDV